MPGNRIPNYQTELLDMLDDTRMVHGLQPIYLGGTSGSGGGVGSPPGGFIGKLVQTRVAYDTTEAELDTGTTSLLDNLNHIRKRIADLEAGGGGGNPWTYGPYSQGSIPFGDTSGSLIQDNSNFFWNTTYKTVVIGSNTNPIAASASYKLVGVRDGGAAVASMVSFGSYGSFTLHAARGSKASPTPVQSGDVLGQLSFYGYQGDWLAAPSYIQAVARETFSSGSNGSSLDFYVVPQGTGSLARAFRLSRALPYGGTSGSMVVIDGNGELDAIPIPPGISGVSGTGSNGSLTAWTGATTIADATSGSLIDLGIGTAAPGRKGHVEMQGAGGYGFISAFTRIHLADSTRYVAPNWKAITSGSGAVVSTAADIGYALYVQGDNNNRAPDDSRIFTRVFSVTLSGEAQPLFMNVGTSTYASASGMIGALGSVDGLFMATIRNSHATGKGAVIYGGGASDAILVLGDYSGTPKHSIYPGSIGFGIASPTYNFHVALNGARFDSTTVEVNDILKVNRIQAFTSGSSITVEGLRERLTGNRTYYVRTDGSDSNTGLANTAGGAFLTIQKAVDVVAKEIDLGIYSVTIQLANGTYSVGSSITLRSLTGAGTCLINGDTTTPANVVIQWTAAGGNLFIGEGVKGTWSLRGMRLTATGGGSPNAIYSLRGSYIQFGNIEFNTGWNIACFANYNSMIEAVANYSILANHGYHWYCTVGSRIIASGITITLTGTPAFTLFAYASDVSTIYCPSNTFSGSGTGTRYSAIMNSTIAVGGGGSTYLPGNAAGSTGTGGQYA